MDNEKIIEVLASSKEPVSGEALSKMFGVSRAAIWKVIESLRKEGYEISSSTKLGYTLSSSPDKLREGEIRAKLTTDIIGKNIVCLDTIDSTNTEIKRRCAGEVIDGLVIISDEQKGGRGRRGNTFMSSKGKGLYISAVLQPKINIGDVANITAWVAVAICEAIDKTFGLKSEIKWTNDIILNEKKLGGILTEIDIEAETNDIRYIVTGIGINCNYTKDDFKGELEDKATSIAIETGNSCKRGDLAANIISALDNMIKKFPETGKKEYLEKYKDKCITLNKDVILVSPDGSKTEAYAIDIDEEFSLIVKQKNGEIKQVRSGEVSVRGLMGYV